MFFWLVYSLIAILCIVLTALPLLGYCDCSGWVNLLVYIFLFIAWFSPVLIWNWQTSKKISLRIYTIVAKVGYFLEGFAFLLMMTLLIRDALWWSVHYLSNGVLLVSPLKDNIVAEVNIITVIAVFVVSLYGIYAAEKKPEVVHYCFADKRIKRPLRVLIASDLHITKITKASKVREWVKYFNGLNVDAVLLPGDIADDIIENIRKQLAELKKIKAPLGVYYTIGNHETYFNPYVWEAEFANLGWQVLHNSGTSIENSGVYVAGVPDNRAFKINIAQSIKNADNEFIILLSHIPGVVKQIGDNQVDLVVSGHTHGGQIFPFNLLTKIGNEGMVSGFYQKGQTKILISRGVGYWGPPMRICASSDIILVELKPHN